jgi:Uncharacterized protein conserved in bacteria
MTQTIASKNKALASDILRIENGVLVEHWDVIQDEATRESSKSGLPCSETNFPSNF